MRPTPQEVLLTKIEQNGAGATTIGQYLAQLTREVWDQEEGFSGKRPFGDSGWKYDIIPALILNGYIAGRLDAYGLVNDYSEKELAQVMSGVFDLLFQADYSTLTLPAEPTGFFVVHLELNSKGKPELSDYFGESYTEKTANLLLESLKDDDPDSLWFVHYIPE